MRAARVACGDRGGLRPDCGGLRRKSTVSATTATMLTMARAPSTMTVTANHAGAGAPCDFAFR